MIEEEEFSPEKWTQKELVKHLYREVSSIHTKLDTMSGSLEGRYARLEGEYRVEFKVIDGRLDKLDQFRASILSILKIVGAIGVAVLGGVITLVIKVFEVL